MSCMLALFRVNLTTNKLCFNSGVKKNRPRPILHVNFLEARFKHSVPAVL